jgi:hypothetical protein
MSYTTKENQTDLLTFTDPNPEVMGELSNQALLSLQGQQHAIEKIVKANKHMINQPEDEGLQPLYFRCKGLLSITLAVSINQLSIEMMRFPGSDVDLQFYGDGPGNGVGGYTAGFQGWFLKPATELAELGRVDYIIDEAPGNSGTNITFYTGEGVIVGVVAADNTVVKHRSLSGSGAFKKQ